VVGFVPVNGTVSVLAAGHTARFVPAANYVGRAGFAFAGTDGDRSTIGFDVDVGILIAETPPAN
jgi:hypothetical protein